jgi:hypothetical protein
MEGHREGWKTAGPDRLAPGLFRSATYDSQRETAHGHWPAGMANCCKQIQDTMTNVSVKPIHAPVSSHLFLLSISPPCLCPGEQGTDPRSGCRRLRVVRCQLTQTESANTKRPHAIARLLLANSVSMRTQEFGIRVALGSSRSTLARLVLRDTSYPVLGGIAWGLLSAAGAVRWVSRILYETVRSIRGR